ncbi:hypothetical protein SAMN04488156_102680 [Bacillus sp. 166amftsu]|nr:hypothetical protein SAMN04488156_102680 [Bacillus sp. 166amftsu]
MHEIIGEVVVGLCEFVFEIFGYGNTGREKKE